MIIHLGRTLIRTLLMTIVIADKADKEEEEKKGQAMLVI